MTLLPHLFLGGHDLEMIEIAALVRETLGEQKLHDAGLSWGAPASAYQDEIATIVGRGETAVLIELTDDLPADFPRELLVVVDHHGAGAGADVPASLRQVFDLLSLPQERWTRWHDLVCVNDIGHMKGLRAFGASPEEIRNVRDADRGAQGVTAQDEDAARAAIANAERLGPLLVVRTQSPHTSPVADFLEPEYGGPGVGQLLVLSPGEANFFGDGAVIAVLSGEPGSWYGGALPARGFWGCPLRQSNGPLLVQKIAKLVANL